MHLQWSLLTPLLEKILKENDQKKKFLTGDFNVDMLKLDSYKQIHKWFILKLFAGSNSFTSKTIIDNMFSNIAESFIKNVATGNTGLGMTCRC